MEEKLMEKNFKKTQQYLFILYILWYVVDYYSDFLDIQKVSDPTKIPVNIAYNDNILHLLFRFKMKKDKKIRAISDLIRIQKHSLIST